MFWPFEKPHNQNSTPIDHILDGRDRKVIATDGRHLPRPELVAAEHPGHGHRPKARKDAH
jgi:hypothetical protein